MPVDVFTEIDIARDVAVVAEYAGDPSNAPEWYANIESVEWKTPPPLGVGTQVAFVARFLGRRLAYTYEVTDFVPGVRLVMQTAQGPFPMETTYTWTALGPQSTRMTLRNQGEPSGFSKPAAPFMAAAVRRANGKDLVKLRSILERGMPSANGVAQGHGRRHHVRHAVRKETPPMSATTLHVVAMGPGRFGVQVTEGDVTTSHEVHVQPDVLDDLGLVAVGEPADEVSEQVVRETFAFLLEREPATAILRSFSLTDVSRYFPDFFDELRTRLAARS